MAMTSAEKMRRHRSKKKANELFALYRRLPETQQVDEFLVQELIAPEIRQHLLTLIETHYFGLYERAFKELA